MTSSSAFIPLINLPIGVESDSSHPPPETSKALIDALKDSGFLLVQTPLLTINLQKQSLDAATEYLEKSGSESVITHPTDPKLYTMLSSAAECASASPVLAEYLRSMETTKTAILRCIAAGLGLEPSYFTRLHDENNNSLRVIRYFAGTDETGNRCREHSDYGTITLLSTDGVSGLEAYHNGQWLPVPHVEGALVVNVGSLMSRWTNGALPATLHRVAGPASEGSHSPKKDLAEAVRRARTSIAFFADPNKDVSTNLQDGKENDDTNGESAGMSVADYIKWRTGGSDADRISVAFTEEEETRMKK